jgi:hypothetical protein
LPSTGRYMASTESILNSTDVSTAPKQEQKQARFTNDVRLVIRVGLLLTFVGLLGLLYGPKATNGFLFWTTVGVCSLGMWLGPLAVVPPTPTGRHLLDPLTMICSATVYYALKGIPVSWGEAARITAQFTSFELDRSYIKVCFLVAIGLGMLALGYRFSEEYGRTRRSGSPGCTAPIHVRSAGRAKRRFVILRAFDVEL